MEKIFQALDGLQQDTMIYGIKFSVSLLLLKRSSQQMKMKSNGMRKKMYQGQVVNLYGKVVVLLVIT